VRPRFQADADLNTQIVLGVRRREPAVEFQTAIAGSVIGRPDPEVLAIAALSDRILVSHDCKTMPGHFAQFVKHQTSPGVILVRQQLAVSSAIEDLILIWAVTDADEWRNRLGFLPL
jgi:predicted nuclease of predicted toxin-antitoxin system